VPSGNEPVARDALPIDAAPVRTPVALALASLLGLACPAKDDPSTAAPRASAVASAAPIVSWSRKTFPPASATAHVNEPKVVASANPAALDELIATAPTAARPPTGPDGGSAIGRDTGLPADSAPPAVWSPPEVRRSPKSTAAPAAQRGMAEPAIERAARAELYWNLVQRCRDPDGHLLPPDAIHLQFNLDAEGSIIPSSIIATAHDPRLAGAAHCMQRALAASTFQAPLSTHGTPKTVHATVPSID
jgi:hypothetical protein